MTGRHATGAPTQRSRARRLALTSVGALIMAFVPWSASQATTPLTAPVTAPPADPGASAATAPMVSAVAAATATTPTIGEFVLPPAGSRTVTLPGAPANATSVTLKVRGRWSWKPTRISVCAGETATETCKSAVALTTPAQRAKTVTVTVTLPATAKNRVTFYNADASVRVRAEVQSYTTPPPPPAPAPAPTKAPEQPKPAPSATTTSPAPAPGAGSGSGSGSGGFANAGSTGVPAGTALTTHSGDLVITQPGTVIDALDVHGLVKIQADNVTIKRTIIRGRPLTSSMALITNELGRYRFTLEDSELRAADASPHVSGIIGNNFEVRRTEIANVIDSVHITGSNVLVENSWLHDNLIYMQDPNHNGGPSHADNVQIQGGSNITFRGNTIEGAHSSAFQTTQDRAAVSGVTVTNNKIDGGACSINVAYGSKYGPIQGFTVANNVFGTSQRHAKCAIIAPSSNTIANTSNTWVDGTPVQVSRG
ncbi:right-handed parallel beta-helix repeat-containing protein [Cellulomonas cellasea]|nr:right-handed parallel beta-helix repeat-containing protein [Cellulomonas cellasea]